MKKTFSYIALLLAAFFWGSTFFIIKDSLVLVNPITLIAYRFIIAAIIFGVIVVSLKKDIWQYWTYGLLLGVINWLVFVAQFVGLQFTTASNSGFITGLFIIFVPIFAYMLFKKKSTHMQLLSLVVAILGLWFLTSEFHRLNIGDGLTIFTAIGNALYILLVDKFVRKNINPFVLNFHQTFVMAILSFITIFLFHLSPSFGNPSTIFSISYLAIVATVIAFSLALIAQRKVNPLTASLLMSTEPVFGAILAWTIGGETFLLSGGIGGSLIFIAILISELPMPRRFIKQKKRQFV